MAKDPPCPGRTLKKPLPQQSSSSAREEEGHWVLMEDRRRRSVAFENLAKEVLRYLDNSEDVNVGIARTAGSLGNRYFLFGKVAQQAMNENGQKFRNF